MQLYEYLVRKQTNLWWAQSFFCIKEMTLEPSLEPKDVRQAREGYWQPACTYSTLKQGNAYVRREGDPVCNVEHPH